MYPSFKRSINFKVHSLKASFFLSIVLYVFLTAQICIMPGIYFLFEHGNLRLIKLLRYDWLSSGAQSARHGTCLSLPDGVVFQADLLLV